MLSAKHLATAFALAAITVLSASGAGAETIVVKYRGPVDLAHMSCESITRSSFINRLCYDAKEKYVVVQLDHVLPLLRRTR